MGKRGEEEGRDDSAKEREWRGIEGGGMEGRGER